MYPLNCLSDIIGELNAIRSTITDRIPGAQRVMLTLRLERFFLFYIMVVLRDVFTAYLQLTLHFSFSAMVRTFV